jgi:hypothetical protein
VRRFFCRAELLAAVSLMEYEVQTNALLLYLLFSLVYLGILCFAKARRDVLAFALAGAFCITLGLRDVNSMSIDADPVLYATILSYPADIKDFLGGADYALFSLLHPITGARFNLSTCFLLLHLLYIPALYLLFKSLRDNSGMFFLLTGWLLFVNSGLLLLANFFRQGISVILFIAILVGLCCSVKKESSRKMGALGLPLLHLASVAMIPSLLGCRMRHYYLISSASFIALCAAIHFAPDSIVAQSNYFNNNDLAMHRMQLWIKIPTIYAMLAFGYLVSRGGAHPSVEAKNIQRGAIGLLIPTAALLLTSNAPVVGLRYLYYSYAFAFLYVACVVTSRRSELLFKASAISMCLFGIVTWTYPSVAMLLIW